MMQMPARQWNLAALDVAQKKNSKQETAKIVLMIALEKAIAVVWLFFFVLPNYCMMM